MAPGRNYMVDFDRPCIWEMSETSFPPRIRGLSGAVPKPNGKYQSFVGTELWARGDFFCLEKMLVVGEDFPLTSHSGTGYMNDW